MNVKSCVQKEVSSVSSKNLREQEQDEYVYQEGIIKEGNDLKKAVVVDRRTVILFKG